MEIRGTEKTGARAIERDEILSMCVASTWLHTEEGEDIGNGNRPLWTMTKETTVVSFYPFYDFLIPVT